MLFIVLAAAMYLVHAAVNYRHAFFFLYQLN